MKVQMQIQSTESGSIALADLQPNQRIELLSQLLVTEIVNYFGMPFFSLEINAANGQLMDIRPTFNLRAGELRKSL